MVDIVNAAPMVIDLGTNDLSASTVSTSSLDFPQHLPKFYIFAEKGPMGPTYIDFSEVSLTQVYGDLTFDVNEKYYTHQTPFLQTVAAQGNNCVVHRLPGAGAKDVANIALYLDVLPTQVPLYQKNTDGSLKLDGNGAPMPQLDNSSQPLTVAGYKVAWVTDKTVAELGEYQPGLLTQRAGLQVDGQTQSTQYPIFEFAAADPGEAGLKLAVRLYAALQTDLVPFPSNVLSDSDQYPFYFQLYKVTDSTTGKTEPVLNSFGAQSAKFVTKAKGLDPASGAVIDLSKVLNDQYIDLPTSTATGLGYVKVYDNNLKQLTTEFYDAEKVIADTARDSQINTLESNVYAMNILSFVSSNGSPYQAIKLVDLSNSTRLTKNTNLFLKGATDGTISEALLDTSVAADMENYNSLLHVYNDKVLHPESMVYDSGYTLATKKALLKFISRRKDTFVVLSTQAHDVPSASLADQYSTGIALKTIAELYPESSTFGTGVMRALVFVGSGIIDGSLYTKRVPTTYEVAYKSALMMGAANGAWKGTYLFDRAPNSVLTKLKKLDVTWVPTTTRNTLWSAGLNFCLNYKTNQQFIPAMQTVYENDTSVLNSYFVCVAIAYLNKIQHAAWREFSGSISLTGPQLIEKVNEFIADKVKDKFAGLFVIVPNTQITSYDAARGYSWTSDIKIYANNMETVMTASISAYRMSDLSS